MRRLVEGMDEATLRLPVNEYWTVAGVLGHIAFWDARIIALAEKLDRGVPFSRSDAEPEDVDWINDASRPLIHAIAPVEVARLALEIADATDAKVAALPVDRLWPADPESPLRRPRRSPGRAPRRHRGRPRRGVGPTPGWRRPGRLI